MQTFGDHKVPAEPIPDNDPLPDKNPAPDNDPVPDPNPVAMHIRSAQYA